MESMNIGELVVLALERYAGEPVHEDFICPDHGSFCMAV